MTCEACSDIPPCTLCGKDLLADLEVEDPRSTVASNLNSNFPHTVFGLISRSLPISVLSVGVLCVCVGGVLSAVFGLSKLSPFPIPHPPASFNFAAFLPRNQPLLGRVWIKPRRSEPSCWAHGAPDCIAFWSRTWSLGSRYPKLWPQK